MPYFDALTEKDQASFLKRLHHIIKEDFKTLDKAFAKTTRQSQGKTQGKTQKVDPKTSEVRGKSVELTPQVEQPLVDLVKGLAFPDPIPEKAPIMKVSKYNLSIVIDE